MKIWINAPFSVENTELIKKSALNCEIFTDTENVDGADIIIGQFPKNYDCSHLKLLQSTNAGVEKLLNTVPENVVITNATGAFGEVIAEYTLAGLLALSRNLFQYRENQKKRLWKSVDGGFMLLDKTALVLGCGNIGRNIALRLNAFGVHTVGIRKNPVATAGFDEVYGSEKLDILLPTADFIICCLPATPLTNKMLGENQFKLMKQGAVLVNVGRGSVVDEKSLENALLCGKLSGAVLDVFESEPLPENSPLWDMENVLITPHISGPSFGQFKEVERKIAEICAENVKRYLNGTPLLNIVNRKSGYAERGADNA